METQLIPRYFTTGRTNPYDDVEWVKRNAEIKEYTSGEVIFSQTDMDFPAFWSQTAVNVVAQKYFKGKQGTSDREYSVKQLISRVVSQIAAWGEADGYFGTNDTAGQKRSAIFRDELTYLLLNQFGSFNSPVWFNVGVPNTNGAWCWSPGKKKAVPAKDDQSKPQVSACFILSIEDTMEDILEQTVREGMIFANGSGAGTNLSTLRASMEYLSGGGKASGPVSFMRGFDAFASVIKSGGKSRRAAKMVILNADHPDIELFIRCKAEQEQIARDLIKLGYSEKFNVDNGAYSIVQFQNANNSVRVTDEFMRAVEKDGTWDLRAVRDGAVIRTVRARDLMRLMADCAWQSGDPGIQYDTTINDWNICGDTERIAASNPCSEYVFLSDSACNLASLNLLKFFHKGVFDIEAFKHAVSIFVLAQEILVDNGGYPTEKIASRSHSYRPLGLGYANLGALLMAMGLPYDSDAGRQEAARITAVMTGQAYLTSTAIAEQVGPFVHWDKNRQSALRVLLRHEAAARNVSPEAADIWSEVIARAQQFGLRNAQTTVLAPTGTISFMMDCDTTGIEPDLSLVKFKSLVGGGTLKLVNQGIPSALAMLGYEAEPVQRIVKYVDEAGTTEGAPGLKPEHLPVFDTSLPSGPNRRSIHYLGHIKMMAAVQPFLSGAISKTVNMPNEATVDDIIAAYQNAWSLGLKSLAIYRDGSKGSQPMSAVKEEVAKETPVGVQRKLVGDRPAIVHEFRLNGHKGFLTVGLYEDGTPGELFVDISKEGSTISGLMDTVAILTSFCLQYGVPLEKLVQKFEFMKFEPAGFTPIAEIRYAHSLPDYIFRWLGLKFLPPKDAERQGESKKTATTVSSAPGTDTPLCSECGSPTVRSGSCHRCPVCGATTGCS